MENTDSNNEDAIDSEEVDSNDLEEESEDEIKILKLEKKMKVGKKPAFVKVKIIFILS